jgi:hypothetical protein
MNMRQFLYLDIDIINSIIAQNEKGLVNSVTTEKENETQGTFSKSLSIGVNGEAGANILKLAKAEASLNVGGEILGESEQRTTAKEIIAKTLHDASFDIAYDAISPVVVEFGKDTADPGDYIELKRVFDFVDLEYLEDLFSKNGIIDWLKKSEREKIEQKASEFTNANMNREQRRQGNGATKQKINELKKQSDKQYDDVRDIISALGKIVPYNRMLVANDGYLIPVEDKYFRINPTSMGFMYGGEIKVIGMITNIIGADTNPMDSDNVFATIQFSVNEALRSLLPTNKNNLYVVAPIAIYYEN